MTEQTVEVATVAQGYTGEAARDAAAQQGIDLEVVKLDEAKRGFVFLPKRWALERSFAWATRTRRLAKGCERLPDGPEGLYFLTFVGLVFKRPLLVPAQVPDRLLRSSLRSGLAADF